MEAEFIKLVRGKLTLQKRNLETIEVPLTILCDDDQEFVRQRKWLSL